MSNVQALKRNLLETGTAKIVSSSKVRREQQEVKHINRMLNHRNQAQALVAEDD